MSLEILGIGTATPQHAITQQDAEEMVAGFSCLEGSRRRALAAIYRATKICSRGSVLLEKSNGRGIHQKFFLPADSDADQGPTTRARLARYEVEAGRLATQAAECSLIEAGIAPSSVMHLVTCSCTGFASPGVDLELMNSLGLRPDISRTHIGFMGCHAAFNALRVASALSASTRSKTVLVVAVELCSLHLQYGDCSDHIVANAIFADGAGALVGTQGQPPRVHQNTAGDPQGSRQSRWRLSHQASVVLPDSSDAMGWTIGDHGFEMQLSPSVPDMIAGHLGQFVNRELAKINLSLASIGSWAVHPGGPRILASVQESLSLLEEAMATSHAVLAEYGNMSSATVMFILERLMRNGTDLPCVALAFGPGLTCEMAVFTTSS